MWQEVLTGIILVAAVFYLVRRFFITEDKKGCGSCGSGTSKGQQKNHKKTLPG